MCHKMLKLLSLSYYKTHVDIPQNRFLCVTLAATWRLSSEIYQPILLFFAVNVFSFPSVVQQAKPTKYICYNRNPSVLVTICWAHFWHKSAILPRSVAADRFAQLAKEVHHSPLTCPGATGIWVNMSGKLDLGILPPPPPPSTIYLPQWSSNSG